MESNELLTIALATYHEMEAVLKAEGRVVESSQGLKPHPAVIVQAEAFKQITKLLGATGHKGKASLQNFMKQLEKAK